MRTSFILILWMLKNNTTFYFSKEKILCFGLFKNAQMQGAQESYREAYMNIR